MEYNSEIKVKNWKVFFSLILCIITVKRLQIGYFVNNKNNNRILNEITTDVNTPVVGNTLKLGFKMA